MSHRCCCRIVGPAYGAFGRSDCLVTVASNDQPFCDECEAAGHPRHPLQQPLRPAEVQQ